MAGVLREFPEQEEFQPRQRHGAVPHVGREPTHIQAELAGPDDLGRPAGLAALVGFLAQPHPDPGEELRQRERLGQVVLSSPLQAVDLGGDVRQA